MPRLRDNQLPHSSGLTSILTDYNSGSGTEGAAKGQQGSNEKIMNMKKRVMTLWVRFSRRFLLKGALFFSLLSVCVMFMATLQKQGVTFNSNAVREKLSKQGKIRELNPWKATVLSCQRQFLKGSGCSEFALTNDLLNLPSQKEWTEQLAPVLKKFGRSAEHSTKALLTHTLTTSEREWLRGKTTVSLVLVRSVQNRVRLLTPGHQAESVGMATNSEFAVPAEALLEEGQVTLEFELTGYPWFGPAEQPVFLAEPDATGLLQSLPALQLAARGLTEQLAIGFPLLLAAMAFILDHSRSFTLLSMYAAARALRSFLPQFVSSMADLQGGIGYLVLVANGLVFAFLVLFLAQSSRLKEIKGREGTVFVAVSVALFLVWGSFDPDLYLKADLWADMGGALLGMALVTLGSINWLNRRQHDALQNPEHRFARLEDTLFFTREAVLFLGLALNAGANSIDLFELANANVKDMLDWRHQALFPILVCTALVEVGSISKKIHAVSKQVAHKARLDREIEIAREYQRDILPEPHCLRDHWEWRSFFKPATQLAGDWFDIRELAFGDGGTLLIVAIVDVTGHGIASALSTSVISSVWSEWCSAVPARQTPRTHAEKEKFLSEAPRRLNFALTASRKAGTGTAIFALLDAQSKEVTLSTAGHPGAVIGDSSAFRYVISSGPTLGTPFERILGRAWACKTEPIPSGHTLFLFTDGLWPPSMPLGTWMARLRRAQKSGPVKLSLAFLNRLRESRALYRSDTTLEDDMTLVMVEFTGVPPS